MNGVTTLLKIKDFLYKYFDIFIIIGVISLAGVILYGYFLSGDRNSRDVVRYANLLTLNDELKLYYSKNNTYPLPDSSVSITASGEILTYQGYFGEKNFEEMRIKGVKDPLGDKNFKYLNYYTYVTDIQKQKFQLMAFYENDGMNSYHPVIKRTPYLYGQNIGIALENKTQRPIQEIKLGVDILQTFDTYTIYMDNENRLIGDKLQLKNYLANTSISQAKSCLEIKQSGWNKNGEYYINPLLDTSYSKFAKPFKVYCDLETDGGGWIRLYYKNGKETCFNGDINYNSFMIEKIFTKDFAISDTLETLQSEGSWILKNIDFKYKDFHFSKMTHVANCKTPSGTTWNIGYNENNFLRFSGILSTNGTWDAMYYGCKNFLNTGKKGEFRIGGGEQHEGEFIHSACNDYTKENNSITSRWDWDNTRVIWVR